jgi:hypothetical protein
MHYLSFRKKQRKLTRSALLISILFLISGNPIAAKSKNAAAQDAARLSGGWVGKIKVVPRGLGAVSNFNIQLKLSNPHLDSESSVQAYDYDVEVNIAPAGKPLVRSNFSDSTLRSYTDQVGYSFEYIPLFSEFKFVREDLRSVEFLEGCERGLRVRSIDLSSAGGPWKGKVECYGKGIGETAKRGEITIQRGQFDESVRSANSSSVDQSERSVVSQQGARIQQNNRTQQAPLNPPSINIGKASMPGILRNIFR